MRLSDFCYRKRKLVLASWVVILALVIGLGLQLPARHKANYQTPNAESTKAYQVLGQRFPARRGDSVNLVFKADAGVNDPGTQTRVQRVIDDIRTYAHVTGVTSPYSPAGASQISPNGKTAYARVDFNITQDAWTPKFTQKFIDRAKQANEPGFQMAFSSLVASPTVGSEFIGLTFAVFILLVAFGSLLAMGLPIVTALFGLGVGATLGGIASRVVMTPDWAPTVGTMIGIGVGIDYALFIVTRYRAALTRGMTPEQATNTAMNTAGRAVLFAGGTVVISLLGMLTMGLQYLHGVVASAVVAVLAVLAVTMTLLPAMLGFVGRNIDRLRLPFTSHRDQAIERAFWYRWSRVVQKRPWPAFVGALIVLAILTAPVFSLRFGFPDDGNTPKEQPTRLAYDLLTEGFGPGYNGPLVLVADNDGDPLNDAPLLQLQQRLSMTNGVAFVVPPVFSPKHDAAIINVFPRSKPQAVETDRLVKRIRSTVIPSAIDGSNVNVRVGGFTAISIDQSNYISRRLPVFIGAVVFLSFLLLLTVFRSVLVAFKAGIMNLLSIAAAYGVMSYAVHGTWLGRLLRIPETPVPSFIPMIQFAILFGLSMDYEVFLLSRIREEYLHTRNNALAVADGLASTARVITAAAAIMVVVFGVFIFDPNAFIKQIGLGLASAVLVDATIVRMILVPSTMELLGDRNWWLPGWLDRVLPEFHVEGEPVIDLGASPQPAVEGAPV